LGSSTNGGGSSIGNFPLPGTGNGTGTSGQNPSGLFPTIEPSSGTPGTGGTPGSGIKTHKPYRASTVADILPLNSGQLSGQAAGLIVLGIGIILVFARISLHKPRSTEGKD
jgi:hypothetical protein